MNNLLLGSCDMNTEMVSLHVCRVSYLIAKRRLCSHSTSDVNTYPKRFLKRKAHK